MAESFMASCYQAEFRFAIEQTGIVRRIERVLFSAKPEADGNLRAVEELAGKGDHAVHEVGLDEGAAEVALASQALRVSGPFTTCALCIAVTGLVGGHAAIGEDGESAKEE